MDVQPEPFGPLAVYHARVTSGLLAGDSSQRAAAERLQDLWTSLRGYDNRQKRAAAPNFRSFMRKLLAPGSAMDPTPRGLYLVGAVGRGKSMLMDLFFETAEVAHKRRIHFHAFIQETHSRIHIWKTANNEGTDPIPPLADAIAAETALLCFDEFQINDITDAMLLGRLFQALFDRGVVVVATSNTEPDDLFKGKPGRDAFLPFIAILRSHLDIVSMDAGRDFRRARPANASWHVPSGYRADLALDQAFRDLTGNVTAAADQLIVMGRILHVPIAAAGVARFDFQALCGVPLGAGDYLALATRYHTLLIDGIPRLKPDNHDEARRFIVLIDALYDHRVKLIASADAMPDDLYARGEGAVAFERTASRLEEMRSPDYQRLPHLS